MQYPPQQYLPFTLPPATTTTPQPPTTTTTPPSPNSQIQNRPHCKCVEIHILLSDPQIQCDCSGAGNGNEQVCFSELCFPLWISEVNSGYNYRKPGFPHIHHTLPQRPKVTFKQPPRLLSQPRDLQHLPHLPELWGLQVSWSWKQSFLYFVFIQPPLNLDSYLIKLLCSSTRCTSLRDDSNPDRAKSLCVPRKLQTMHGKCLL